MVGRRDKGHHNDFRFLAEMTGEAVKPPTKTGHEAAREESSTSVGKCLRYSGEFVQLKTLQRGSGTPNSSGLVTWVQGSSACLGRGEISREGKMAQAEYE